MNLEKLTQEELEELDKEDPVISAVDVLRVPFIIGGGLIAVTMASLFAIGVYKTYTYFNPSKQNLQYNQVEIKGAQR